MENKLESIAVISNDLCIKSLKGVKYYFPIDRYFIEENGYLERIKKIDKIEFIFYNLEIGNITYTVQLFVCLPEIWENIRLNDFKEMFVKFTNSFSFYGIIEFSYKYLEIDLFDEIFLNTSIDVKYKKDCLTYFKNRIASLYMSEEDYIDLKEGIFGVSLEQWIQMKEKIILNKEFKKTLPINNLLSKLMDYEKW